MRHEWGRLCLVLVAYLVIGTLYAVLTPAWQVPDEPAHYNYVAQIAREHILPVIEPGDYDQDRLVELVSSGFAPESGDIEWIEYADYHPPLYYLLAAPIFAVSGGSLVALRLFSVLLGAALIVTAWGTVRTLLPHKPAWALGVAMWVAFVPQHVAMMAGVNNDALAELLIGVGLWASVAWLRWGSRRLREEHLGLLAGLAFLTKASAYFIAVILGLAILVRWKWGEGDGESAHSPGAILSALARFAIPALILGGVWWARDVSVYGWPDFLGKMAHDAVVVGQPRTSEWVADMGAAGLIHRLAVTTFHSFWGQFGWMAVPMTGRIYAVLGIFSAFVALGLLLRAWRVRPGGWPRYRLAGVALMGLSVALVVALYLAYNVTFVQHQGRYLFPAMIPLGVAVVAGLDGWVGLLPIDRRMGQWLPALLLVWLAPFSSYALFRILLPTLAR